jgi:hypothetical protein
MADKHITVENADGASPTSRWHTTETYKVSEAVASQFAALKTKPTGRAMKDWIQDHGGVLDDGDGKPGKVSTKSNGAQLIDHYVDGKMTTTDYVKPKGKDGKEHDHAGAELLLALFTGGASLFIPHDLDAADKKPESKFGTTTSTQTATAENSGSNGPKEQKPATTASTGPKR